MIFLAFSMKLFYQCNDSKLFVPNLGPMGSACSTGGTRLHGRICHLTNFHIIFLRRGFPSSRTSGRSGKFPTIESSPLLPLVGRRRRLRPVHVVPLLASRRESGLADVTTTLAALHHYLLRRGYVCSSESRQK